VVFAGGITRGELARRGRGIVGIDGDKLASIDSSLKSKGKLLFGFAHGAAGAKFISYGLKGFTPNSDNHEPVNAIFRALRGPKGATIVRLAGYYNIPASKDATTKELLIARARWLPAIGGRADVVAVPGKGDVPAGKAYVAHSCWNAALKEGRFIVKECEAGKGAAAVCTTIKEEGKLEDCGLGLRDAKAPSEDPNADSAEDAADTGVEAQTPPTDTPDGSGA
jgi:hypothetical protein